LESSNTLQTTVRLNEINDFKNGLAISLDDHFLIMQSKPDEVERVQMNKQSLPSLSSVTV
jgi:hypothetical protein